jgi:hypothetical protein
MREEKRREEKRREERTRQGKKRKDKARQDKERQDKTRHKTPKGNTKTTQEKKIFYFKKAEVFSSSKDSGWKRRCGERFGLKNVR